MENLNRTSNSHWRQDFCLGDYITCKEKVEHPSMQTLRIKYFVGNNGAETVTAITGGNTVTDLSKYRNATREEIISFLEMELNIRKMRL